ncbi:hypothetical protein E5D57_010911 [Metarhizium anisopliae]|nr:hypothetical protein E5D57_010911 [Metarhizium anisopliae]
MPLVALTKRDEQDQASVIAGESRPSPAVLARSRSVGPGCRAWTWSRTGKEGSRDGTTEGKVDGKERGRADV